MKFKSLVVLFLSLILGSIFVKDLCAGITDPKSEFYTHKTEHFYIHYPKEIGAIAEDFIPIAEKVYSSLVPKFNWEPWERIHVVLADQMDDANGFATLIPASTVYLIVNSPEASSPLDNYKNYLEMLFTHELSHILHLDQTGGMARPLRFLLGKAISPNSFSPAWMREGIASYIESQLNGRGRSHYSFSDMILRSAIYENNFPKIDEVSSGRVKWMGGNAAYIYGANFFQWLADNYGEDRMYRYMKEYGSTLWFFSLNSKARRVYDKNFYKLWKEWQESLNQKYSEFKTQLESKGLTPFQAYEINVDHESRNIRNLYKNAIFSYPHFNPESSKLSYILKSLDDTGGIILSGSHGSDTKVKKLSRIPNGQLSYSNNKKYLAFSVNAMVERYRVYSEILTYDLEKKKIERVLKKDHPKKSLRGRDPDFSPKDGGDRWLLFVRNQMATDNLFIVDLKREKGYYLTESSKYTQFSNPRFSPDGDKIAVSRRDHNGNRDIVLYSSTGDYIQHLTKGEAIDNYPTWSPDGRYVYLESDRDGVPNIYRFDLKLQELVQVTNVLNGVYQPHISPDGKTLYVQYFTSQGPRIYYVPTNKLGHYWSYKWGKDKSSEKMDHNSDRRNVMEADFEDLSFAAHDESSSVIRSHQSRFYSSAVSSMGPDYPREEDFKYQVDQDNTSDSDDKKNIPVSAYEKAVKQKAKRFVTHDDKIISGSKKYKAIKHLFPPRFFLPGFAFNNEGFNISAVTGRTDPLRRHSWTSYINYSTDSDILGYGAKYFNTHYWPSFYASVDRYVINWGEIFFAGDDFYEERIRGQVGVSLPFGRHSFNADYFYEERDNVDLIPSGFDTDSLSENAGVNFSYFYQNYKKYPYSISQENGAKFRLSFEITDSILGSSDANERRIFTGDFRYYFEMPWSDHHVLAFKAAGGFVWGDEEDFVRGSLRFGGPIGEQAGSNENDLGLVQSLVGFTTYSSKVFNFRGLPNITYSRDRIFVSSLEYRFPLLKVERGLGTTPIYLKQLHMALFSDFGNAWMRNDVLDERSEFLLSIGSEFRGDFQIGYFVPMTMRLGYGLIVLNRDRVAGFKDDRLGMDVKNGVLYFELGTSF